MKRTTGRMLGLLNLVLLSTSLAGCGTSLFSYRESNPVIRNWVSTTPFFPGAVTTFATTASRRMALIRDDKGYFEICSEPPPDVGEAFASAIAAGLAASGSVTQPAGAKASNELAAQYAHAVATQIAPLIYRTQGLQLYRDANYFLCVDKMNNWVSQTDYVRYKNEHFNEALELIKTEIPNMATASSAFFTNVKAGQTIDITQLLKILEALKSGTKEASPDTTSSTVTSPASTSKK